MARKEARIFASVWRDADAADFRAVSRNAQWLYFFLLSQEDLAYDGVLPHRLPRWTDAAPRLTAKTLAADLAELETARFVVVDETAGEVLIRSLMRRDEIFKIPNVLRSAAKHLPSIRSERIRATLADELRRIASEERLTTNASEIVTAMLGHLTNRSASPLPNLRGEREEGKVTTVTTDLPLPPSPLSSSRKPSVAAQVVLDNTDATVDEAHAVAEAVQREHKPRSSLAGFLRAMAERGDLDAYVQRARVSTVLAAARDGPPCPHGQPGGTMPHPTTGEPLCPLCRTNGVP